MDGECSTAAVIVGIDGSDAAIDAGVWAVDEALARGAPLRLVYAIDDQRFPGTVHGDVQAETTCAQHALDRAIAAIRATGKTVSTTAEIRHGYPDDVMINESRDASLVCLGSTGIGWLAGKILGSTAQSVAENAHCPVAVLRHSDDTGPARANGVIVVGFQRALREDRVFRQALDEARLRHATLIAVGLWQEDFGATPYDQLDRCVEQWRQRYPDVHVYPVASRADLPRFLADNADGHVQLAVIDGDDADQVADIVGPQGHALLVHGRCSVLIAR